MRIDFSAANCSTIRLEPIEPTAEMQQAIDDAGRHLEGLCGRR